MSAFCSHLIHLSLVLVVSGYVVESIPLSRREDVLLDNRPFTDQIFNTKKNEGIYQFIIPKKGQQQPFPEDLINYEDLDDDDDDVMDLPLKDKILQRLYIPDLYEDGESGDEEYIYAEKRSKTPLNSKHKKDLESLLYQANPALTVQKLPRDPQIDFRKFDRQRVFDRKEDGRKKSPGEKPFSQKLRGMKEVVQPRPSLRRDQNLRDLRSLSSPDGSL